MASVSNTRFAVLWMLLVTMWHIFPGLLSPTQEESCLEESFLTLPGLTVEECKDECLMRKRCKSVRYNRRFPLCKLYEWDETDPVEPCRGFVYMDMKNLDRPRGCDECDEKEVCEPQNNNACVIKECTGPTPKANGYFLGNLHTVGSKRLFKCNFGYMQAHHINTTSKQIVCSISGVWKPDIKECLHITYICENEIGNFSCSHKNDTILDIRYANYGRTSDAICKGAEGNRSYTDCHHDVTNRVKELCQGNNTCTVYTRNALFRDPCETIHKYLEVGFDCKYDQR